MFNCGKLYLGQHVYAMEVMYLIIELNGRSWALMQAAFNQRLETDLIPVLWGKITLNISTAKDTAGTLGGAMLVI